MFRDAKIGGRLDVKITREIATIWKSENEVEGELQLAIEALA
jgi:hypothetical protein